MKKIYYYKISDELFIFHYSKAMNWNYFQFKNRLRIEIGPKFDCRKRRKYTAYIGRV